MATAGVYVITHTATGRQYVGSSINVARRMRVHKAHLVRGAHHSSRLQRAWDKYGESAFTFSVVIICGVDLLRDYEQRCIDGLNSELNGSGTATSPTTRGSKLPPAWRANVVAAIKARYAKGLKIVHPPRSVEYRRRVSAAVSARWSDPAMAEKTVEAIRAAMTEKEKEKRSGRTAALWKDPEYRAKAVLSRKGNTFAKGYKCTPEQVANRRRAARIANMKRAHGEQWERMYIATYPEHAGDVHGH